MWTRSFRLILRQQWLTYTLIFIIGFIGALITYWTFPGEEGVQAMLGLADTAFVKSIWGELITNLDSENSDFFLYFIFLYFIAYMANVYPIAGIWLGGAGTADEIKSGMADIFISSPHRKAKLVLRHLISHLLLLTFLTLLVNILIPISYDLLGTSINYERVFSGFILLWISGIIFFSVSFCVTSITLRSDIGRGIAFIIFILSFLLTMIVNMNPNYEDLKYMNILHYTNLTPILMNGEALKFDNFIPLITSIFLLTLGVLIFLSKDLLPLQINQNQIFGKKISDDYQSKFLSFREKITLKDYIKQLIQKISPISAEQWVADRTIFIIFFILCFFGVISIIIGYPTGEGGFAEMAQIYRNNPFANAIIRNSMEQILDDPLGPIYPQFYGYSWLYFFPIIIIGAGRVVDRDKHEKTIDLLLGTPTKPRNIIFPRIGTIIFELTILSSMAVIFIILGEFFLEIDSKIFEQLLALLIIPFTYGTTLCFLIAVSLLLPSPDHRKKIVYTLGALTIILVVLPYFSEPLMPLRFLSPLYYMDLVGLIAQGYQIEHVSLLFVLLGILIFSLLVIFRTSNNTTYV
jgi:ABC-type transport system involved in multi-copper enzyme maturation permease subunit